MTLMLFSNYMMVDGANPAGIHVMSDIGSYKRGSDDVVRPIQVGTQKIIRVFDRWLVALAGYSEFYDLERFPLSRIAPGEGPTADALSRGYTASMFDNSERHGRSNALKIVQRYAMGVAARPSTIDGVVSWLLGRLPRWIDWDREGHRHHLGTSRMDGPRTFFVLGADQHDRVRLDLIAVQSDGSVTVRRDQLPGDTAESQTRCFGIDDRVIRHQPGATSFEQAGGHNAKIFRHYADRYMASTSRTRLGDDEGLNHFLPSYQHAIVNPAGAVVHDANFVHKLYPRELVVPVLRDAYDRLPDV